MSGRERVLVLLLLAGLLCLGLWQPTGVDARCSTEGLPAVRLGSAGLGWEGGKPCAFVGNEIIAVAAVSTRW